MHALARGTLAVTLLSLALASGASAQASYPNVKLAGRLQEQIYYFDNDVYAAVGVGPNSNIFTRRARIEARGEISENVTVFIQPSFEGGRNLSSVSTTCTSTPVPAGGGTPIITCRTTGRSGLRLRDAWIDVRFTKAVNKSAIYFRAGQEKRPYSRYELTSSTNLPSIERGAGQGLLPLASNDLFARRRLSLPRRGRELEAGAQAGRRAADYRQVRRLQRAGREPERREQQEELRRAAPRRRSPRSSTWARSWFTHDGIVTVGDIPDSSFTNTALGVDAQWGKPGDEGLYVLAEYLEGDDTRPPS